jgi:hypothetical protein
VSDTPTCARCGHPQDWHRHDDTAPPNEDGHNSHGMDVDDDQECPYRCIGYDCEAPGSPPADPCGCPGFTYGMVAR